MYVIDFLNVLLKVKTTADSDVITFVKIIV